ncbi:class I SAM-dependent methyltransferase [Sulfurospirillum deleyianum]|uniref:Tellurite resistance protein TehB n=1 Tax=Sulfurospirillum deleyianum (strain ATCC 51133 / DSM 6946 / 5175) TaxID=525898 RepID=D1B586_SULD5|nr:class I SAM-dependent methyltransferase [Sulfurospirillum deleyianum]ACZ13256.1 tellurite resistance protein TehB [Sulfurospirillum deleyianum DSM 6946]
MQALWDEKFSKGRLLYGEAPNAFIESQFYRMEKAKRVLCLGEGEGRNALFLAEQGIPHVEALDASFVALSRLRHLAKERYVAITLCHTLIAYWSPRKESYDAIVCSYLHLQKPEQKLLFEKIIDALKPKGVFIGEFFSTSQRHFKSGGPMDEDLLYDINHLSHLLKSLPCLIRKLSQEVIRLEEGTKHVGEASVIRMVIEKTKED